jgi:hypothetical protein
MFISSIASLSLQLYPFYAQIMTNLSRIVNEGKNWKKTKQDQSVKQGEKGGILKNRGKTHFSPFFKL